VKRVNRLYVDSCLFNRFEKFLVKSMDLGRYFLCFISLFYLLPQVFLGVFKHILFVVMNIKKKVKLHQYHYRSEVPRAFQQVKVPRLRDNGPGWW